MKLSIITINKNNACGLRETIESVVHQTYTDFEYIVIDGASTDGSVGVIKEFEEKITYWVSEPDSGIYSAMNKGIEKSSGDYLLFLNSGDFLVNKSVLRDVFSHDCSAEILCAACNVSKDGIVIWISNPPENVTFGTLYNVGLSHQSTFIKKSLFERVGYYREDFKYNSDIDFWYRSIILNGASTQKIDVVTTNYNLDGVSERCKNDPLFKEEHRMILSNPLYEKFIPDYEQWKRDRVICDEYSWINNQKMLKRMLRFFRKIQKKL